MGMFGAKYVTQLPPDQEAQFKVWQSKLPDELRNGVNYDLRAAFQQDPRISQRAHLGDIGKTPEHITFSNESKYSTPDTPGGVWTETGNRNPQTGENSYVFWASPTNMQYHSIPEMTQYFQQYEPGNMVVLPYNYRLPPR